MENLKVAVVGLGYVGLPLALALAKKVPVIGFDIQESKLEILRQNIDPNRELDSDSFENTDIQYTHQLDELRSANFFIIGVPTPINEYNNPDLTALLRASETVGKVLKKGDYVVYESTVYPGCTEEDCVPVLEKISGLKAYVDFKVGYSPERINPGDKKHMLHNTTKIVSGCDEEALRKIAYVYNLVVEVGLHEAPSIKVAEAAKIIENTQRDVNISLMNELSMIFNQMGINTHDVIEAAGRKWNFLKFYPGLVGGHCIGVDPYYLTYKASQVGHQSKVILAGRSVNDSIGYHIAQQTVKNLIKHNDSPNLKDARVLVMGVTFKEDVSDIRNSRVIDIINELRSFSIAVDAVDPKANLAEFEHEYGIKLIAKIEEGVKYDAVVLAVAHTAYKSLSPDFFKSVLKENGLLVDVKGLHRQLENSFPYWSL